MVLFNNPQPWLRTAKQIRQAPLKADIWLAVLWVEKDNRRSQDSHKNNDRVERKMEGPCMGSDVDAALEENL